MIARETARLRKAFERILILSAASSGALGVHACSSGSSTSSGAGGEHDASAMNDATSPGDSGHGGNDAAADGGGDSPSGTEAGSGCSDDAGPDALWSSCCEPPPAEAWDAGADVPSTCVYQVSLPCGLPPWVQNIFPPSCNLYLSDCAKICTGAAAPFVKCEIANGYGCDDDAMAFVAADGEAIRVQCDKCNGVGRRPAGLAIPRGRRSASALGDYFAAAAHLEAASVHAFERLAGELEAHRLPRVLARAARRSARDEVRHARVTTRLARRFGGEPPAVRVAARRTRTLTAIALENAIEGCVRETFGALLASWQARSAQDPEVRRAMTRIAADETRHAALAWAVARAVEARLDAAARKKVASARARAIAKLRRDVAAGFSGKVACAAGLPGPERTSQMLDALAASVWS